MGSEWAAYSIARTVVAMAGLFILVFAAVVPMILPTSMVLRIFGLAVGLPMAALMLYPNRPTFAGRLFKFRLVPSILVGDR